MGLELGKMQANATPILTGELTSLFEDCSCHEPPLLDGLGHLKAGAAVSFLDIDAPYPLSLFSSLTLSVNLESSFFSQASV
jgi:hypothetical protein